MSEDNKYAGIVEVFEFTSAAAASIGSKSGKTELLGIFQGVDHNGQPCVLYIMGRRAPKKELTGLY